ncbi:hypothetical protein [Sphingomonas sp. R86520]|uniref:hypothetical protein n=1 Tax=Sphingomonas sp. R86520 TaxID=3093859 RepID=UPI0036D420BF
MERPATRAGRAGGAAHVELRPGCSARDAVGLHVSSGDGFDALPALNQSPAREQAPAIELDQRGQGGRNRQRQQERERQRGHEPDIGFGR